MEHAEPDCRPAEHESQALRAPIDPANCQRAAEIFRALGEPSRLRMLTVLMEGEMCVTELALRVDDNLPAVSQRLKLLRSERIVRSRRDGKHVFYSLADQHISELIANAVAHAGED